VQKLHHVDYHITDSLGQKQKCNLGVFLSAARMEVDESVDMSTTSAKQATADPPPKKYKINGKNTFYNRDGNLLLITADNYKFLVDDLYIRAVRCACDAVSSGARGPRFAPVS
jgi:hypothetical protein